MRLTEDVTARYLRRLGLSEPPSPDLDGLRALHEAHLRCVPFENLDIHLGVPITLGLERIVDKLTRRRRGGFCYELNGAFSALLTTLGFDVRLLEARVYDGAQVGIRFDHACLLVDLDPPYVADVGFGSCFEHPLRLEPGIAQVDPAGDFELMQRADGDVDLVHDGSPLYRFSLVPRSLLEFAGGCSFHQTSPDSHFTRGTVCSMLTPDGRVTIQGMKLIETTPTGRRESSLKEEELGAAYRAHFSIELDPAAVRLLCSSRAT
jgi:N-hydroxyarylamine O-acetyltransferase